MQDIYKKLKVTYSFAQASYVSLFVINIILQFWLGIGFFSSRLLLDWLVKFCFVGIASHGAGADEEAIHSIGATYLSLILVVIHSHIFAVILTMLGKKIHVWIINLFYFADFVYSSVLIVKHILGSADLYVFPMYVSSPGIEISIIMDAIMLSLGIAYLIIGFYNRESQTGKIGRKNV